MAGEKLTNQESVVLKLLTTKIEGSHLALGRLFMEDRYKIGNVRDVIRRLRGRGVQIETIKDYKKKCAYRYIGGTL